MGKGLRVHTKRVYVRRRTSTTVDGRRRASTDVDTLSVNGPLDRDDTDSNSDTVTEVALTLVEIQ